MKFSAFYGVRSFITMFTRASHCSVSNHSLSQSINQSIFTRTLLTSYAFHHCQTVLTQLTNVTVPSYGSMKEVPVESWFSEWRSITTTWSNNIICYHIDFFSFSLKSFLCLSSYHLPPNFSAVPPLLSLILLFFFVLTLPCSLLFLVQRPD